MTLPLPKVEGHQENSVLHNQHGYSGFFSHGVVCIFDVCGMCSCMPTSDCCQFIQNDIQYQGLSADGLRTEM